MSFLIKTARTFAAVAVATLGLSSVATADDQAARIVVGDSSNFVLAYNASALLDPTVCSSLLSGCTTNAGQWNTILSTNIDASGAASTTLIAETSAVTALLTGDLVNNGFAFLSGAGIRARVIVDCGRGCDPTKDVGTPGGPSNASLMAPGVIFLDQVLRAALYCSDAPSFLAEASLYAGARSFNFYSVGKLSDHRSHSVIYQVSLNTPNYAAGAALTGSAAVVGKRTMILSAINADSHSR